MLDGRKILLVTVMVLAACVQGCLMGAIAATTSTYVATSKPATEALTDASRIRACVHVEDALEEWMRQRQLPIPVLDPGTHAFRIRSADFVKVKGAAGARVVELWDGERLIAEYTVSWDRMPVEYRLASVRNLVYDEKLDVSNVPVIKTYAPD